MDTSLSISYLYRLFMLKGNVPPRNPERGKFAVADNNIQIYLSNITDGDFTFSCFFYPRWIKKASFAKANSLTIQGALYQLDPQFSAVNP